jgi:trehalose-6-phosphatase
LIEDTDLLNKNHNDLYIYLGDDDKDEEAFEIIHEMGGLAILVSPEPRRSRADFRLDSPADVRLWLAECFLNGDKQK